MGNPSNKLTLEQWKDRTYSANPHMHILNKTLPQGTKEDPFICHCDDCGATFPSTKGAIKTAYSKSINNPNYKWCPVCCNQLCIAGINDVATTNPEIIKYLANPEDATKYTRCSTKEVLCRCPDCGHERMRKVQYLTSDGFSCEMCSDNISFPNKICRGLLKQLPVDEYEPEYIRDWTQGRKYDGYFKLNNQKYLLEFDGKQHFQDSSWGSVEKQIKNDKLKTKLAKQNGYILIRINCFDSSFDSIVNEIYSSVLYELFDLDAIDWNLIHIQSMNNVFLEIVDYYNNYNNPTSTEIKNKFGLERHTIYKYLKKADTLNLIKYVPEKHSESSKTTRKNNLNNKKRNHFSVYDPNGSFIKDFYIIRECADYLNNKFNNIHFNSEYICTCLQTGTKYKGFSFVYYDKTIIHSRNPELVKKICEYFLENQDKMNTEIAKDLNTNNTFVYKSLCIGIQTGIIDLKKLKPCAFLNKRFCEFIN